MTALLASGLHEWKSLGAPHQGNSVKGLSVAVAIHIVLIGLFYSFGPTDLPEKTSRIIDVFFPGQEPLQGMPQAAPPAKVGGGLRAAGKGFPVAVNSIDEIEKSLTDVESSGSPNPAELDGPGNGGEGLEEGGSPGQSGFPGGVVDLTKDWTGTLEKYPIPIREVKPEYPDFARRAGIEGTVTVKILINKYGRPEKAEIFKSDAELLNEAAIEAAMKWLFVPAVMNNNTVAVWVAVPFRFRVAER